VKTVIAAGDSFTRHSTQENRAWPFHLDESMFDMHLCAEMGSSNTMIARNALYQLEQLKDKPDRVLIVGWSDYRRFDLHFDCNHAIFNDVKQVEETHDHKVTNFINNDDTANSAWLKSTGGYGIWKFNNSDIDRIVSNYYDDYHSDTKQYIESLQAVLLLQYYCQVNNIPMFNFKAWQNGMLESEIQEAQYLEDLVDLSTWWFFNGNQGLLEWARSKGDHIPKGLHPSAKYQNMFCEHVITTFLKGLE
jgi:hypothetical protein